MAVPRERLFAKNEIGKCGMNIRSVEPKDYEAYCALAVEADELHSENAPRYYKSSHPPRPREYFSALLNDPNRGVFVAEIDGEAVGYINLESKTDPDLPVLVPMRWTNISEVVVGRKHQRKGVGHALIEKGKEGASRQGSQDLRLSVADFNEGAKAFYQQEGFKAKIQTLTFFLS
jgi:ribosomal protein S18 acetylase RimI-like enzyme